MPQLVRVQKFKGINQFAVVENGATVGATVGVNLYNKDGTLYVPPAGAASAPSGSISIDDVQTLGPQSVAVTGSLGQGAATFKLVGDALAPGNTYYYGTGPTGTKGWNTVASALLGSTSVTLTTAANGATTFSLPVPTGDLSGAWPDSQVVSTHLTNPLPVAQGGTAQASLTAHAVLLGEGTAGVGNAPTGTAGALLVDQGASADPAFKAMSGDATLAAGGALTLAASGVTAGVYGDATHWAKITLDAKGRATAAQSIALPLLQGYIDGLQMQWVSGTAITVTSGTAYIPGLGTYLASNAPINLTGLSLTASTWYHLYLYSNAGTPAVECVTTAPVLYYGTAYQKTGDATRRYIGSVLTDSGGSIYGFDNSDPSRILYVANINGSPFRVSVAVLASVTTVACSVVVPSTASAVTLNCVNNDTSHPAWLGNSNLPGGLSSANYFELIGSGAGGTTLATDIPLDSSQSFTALQGSGATLALAIRVRGYWFRR